MARRLPYVGGMRHLAWLLLLAGCTGTLSADTVDAGERGRDAGAVTEPNGSPPPLMTSRVTSEPAARIAGIDKRKEKRAASAR